MIDSADGNGATAADAANRIVTRHLTGMFVGGRVDLLLLRGVDVVSKS
jgi:hypothetical protein